MKKGYYFFTVIIVILLLLTLYFLNRRNALTPTLKTPAPVVSRVASPAASRTAVSPPPMPTVTPSLLANPIDEFESRITKKTFGQYITPQNSPVQPEKFTGYHTGVDVEYEDEAEEVEVRSVADGEVVFSGFVNGYGGLVIVSHLMNSNYHLSLYGHLDPASLAQKGEHVSRSQKIGILGEGFTNETDGERKHLHFAVIKGSQIDYRGYVQSESELSGWVNPVDFINNNGEV